MASDQKVLYIKVVRNVETVNFSFGVIIIRRSIQLAEILQESDGPVSYITKSDSKLKMTPWSIQDGLIWKNDQHESCLSRQGAQIWYFNLLNQRSYGNSTACARNKTEVWTRFGLNPSWSKTKTLGHELM